jgi:hypothetical protein
MTMRMTLLLLGIGLLAGCGTEEPPPRTVTEFLDNPILLEAAMVRCSRDRRESRYEPECVNAREAVKRVQAREEEARRRELEARSDDKRKALRRMREAQEEARRRAEEAERLRKEAEYLAQFGVLPPSGDESTEAAVPAGNVPIAVVPEADSESVTAPPQSAHEPSVVGSNAPTVEITPPEENED